MPYTKLDIENTASPPARDPTYQECESAASIWFSASLSPRMSASCEAFYPDEFVAEVTSYGRLSHNSVNVYSVEFTWSALWRRFWAGVLP